MATMDFTEFSLRYAIICSLAVVAVYMLVLLLRLVRIKRRQSAPGGEMKFDADGIYRREVPASGKRVKAQTVSEPESMPQPRSQEQFSPPFGEQLYRSGVEADLERLRGEVAELKETIAQLKAARRVSPQYNEAMHLAQRGMDEQGIANQCGISIGEAELVLALSRNKQEYEDYDGKNDGRE